MVIISCLYTTRDDDQADQPQDRPYDSQESEYDPAPAASVAASHRVCRAVRGRDATVEETAFVT